MLNFNYDNKPGQKRKNVSMFYKCKFYQDLLNNIKITLIFNKKTLTLNEFCYSVLNSRKKFQEIILNEDKMRNAVILLNFKFKGFYAIRYILCVKIKFIFKKKTIYQTQKQF